MDSVHRRRACQRPASAASLVERSAASRLHPGQRHYPLSDPGERDEGRRRGRLENSRRHGPHVFAVQRSRARPANRRNVHRQRPGPADIRLVDRQRLPEGQGRRTLRVRRKNRDVEEHFRKRQQPGLGGFYVSVNGPSEELGMLVRAANASGGALALLPAGQVRVERLRTETLAVEGRARNNALCDPRPRVYTGPRVAGRRQSFFRDARHVGCASTGRRRGHPAEAPGDRAGNGEEPRGGARPQTGQDSDRSALHPRRHAVRLGRRGACRAPIGRRDRKQDYAGRRRRVDPGARRCDDDRRRRPDALAGPLGHACARRPRRWAAEPGVGRDDRARHRPTTSTN